MADVKMAPGTSLSTENVLINVLKSVFIQVSYQPSLRVQPESLFFFYVGVSEPSHEWFTNAWLLKQKKQRTCFLKCHEDHQSAVSLPHCDVRELNYCSVVTRMPLNLDAECDFFHFNKMSARDSNVSLSLPDGAWRSVYEPIWLIVSLAVIHSSVNM